MNEWKNWQEAFREEFEQRNKVKIEELCRYGITALDDPLVAIAKNELVVIGADSGVGKSSLAIDIAQHNAKRDKRVALYYLEGGHLEAISRMKWRDMMAEYYKNHYHRGIETNYRKWVFNYYQDPLLAEIEDEQYKKYKDVYKDNLMLYAVSENLTIDDLIKSLWDFHDLFAKGSEGELDLDLIIIDHLQYFSLTKSENEIFEITKILREVKNITDKYNVPVILISHLRKKGKDRGLPGQEDFYGSSNIPKIATTVVTIASLAKKNELAENIYLTCFRIVKSRIGIRPNYGILTKYDLNKRTYENGYGICQLDSFGNIKRILDRDDLPKWVGENYGKDYGKEFETED